MHPDHHDDDRRITYFAATHTRGKREMFGIRAIDRGKHVYVIGKTGMGKSTMLENMAIQDIQNGEGIAFIDPHGSTAEKLLDFIPHDRIKDVVYFAPFDTENPMGFNVMEDVGFDKRHLVVSGLMGALKRIWVDAWSARMEYILQNTLLALLEYPGSTLLDVNRMLTNKTFRDVVIEQITDSIVKSFWTEEFAGFTDTYTREATPAIQNKIGQFTANPLIRHIVGQSTSSFDLRKIMDEKKIFIVNLSKGRMGETNAALLGSMLTVKIYLAAMSRADEPASVMTKLPRFYFYVDEFQSMMNEAFADILSESRKYKLALTLANQYIEQMEETVRDAVFGNVGTLITFRVGPFDAETLKTVFEPTFEAEDLVGLGIGEIYLTLMIDGVGSAPFSAQTIPPIDTPNISYREDVITRSRAVYGRPRADVEAAITARMTEFVAPPRPSKKDEYRARIGLPPIKKNSETTTQNQSTHTVTNTLPPKTVTSAATMEPHEQSQSNVLPRPVTRSPAEVMRATAIPAVVSTTVGVVHPHITPPLEKKIERTEVPTIPPTTDPRLTLRAAIEKAKHTGPATPAPTTPPTRSPADTLRSRLPQRPFNSIRPVHPTKSPAHTQEHTGVRVPDVRDVHAKQPIPSPVKPSQVRSKVPEVPKQERNPEVSNQLLRRILHPSNRTADE